MISHSTEQQYVRFIKSSIAVDGVWGQDFASEAFGRSYHGRTL